MGSHGYTIHPNLCPVVDCAEVHTNMFVLCVLWQDKGSLIPYATHEIQISHTGQSAFRAEWNLYSSLQGLLFNQSPCPS